VPYAETATTSQPISIGGFLRAKAARGCAAFGALSALLAAGAGIGFYYSNLSFFRRVLAGVGSAVPATVLHDCILTESLIVGAAVFGGALLLGLAIFTMQYRQWVEREAAESAVRASETRARDFADTASDWYWETDAQHRFTFFSSRLLAYADPNAFLGHSRIDLGEQSDPNPVKWTAHRAMLDRHDPFRDFVYRVRLRNRFVHIQASGKPIFGPDGAFLGYRGSSRDVTEQIQGEERLREAKRAAEAANRSKSEFLANMSHELRTPLNAIIGFADIITKELFGKLNVAQYKEYARDIAVSGGSLLEIINDILDMSKIEAGRLELREDTLDIAAIVGACQRLIAPRASEADVALDSVIPSNLPQVRGDELRIKQIVLNLLSNAVKFTPHGGRVTVTAGLLPEGNFELAVTDTGIGMSADQIEIALQPFRQVDSSLARKSQGTGLGLPLVKAFAELHGGRLRIRSVPGEGTTVVIILPARRVVAPQPAELPA
jgi:signal transduction histidine kinase